MYDFRLEIASADVDVSSFMNTDELVLKDKGGKITFEMGRNEAADIAAGMVQSFNPVQMEVFAENLVSCLSREKIVDFISEIERQWVARDKFEMEIFKPVNEFGANDTKATA